MNRIYYSIAINKKHEEITNINFLGMFYFKTRGLLFLIVHFQLLAASLKPADTDTAYALATLDI